MNLAVKKSYVFTVLAVVAFLISPWVASASVIASQQQSQIDFNYNVMSSGPYNTLNVATTSTFDLPPATRITALTGLFSPDTATSSEAYMTCNNSFVARWEFQLVGNSFATYLLTQGSTTEPYIGYATTNLTATTTCSIRFAAGSPDYGGLVTSDPSRNVGTAGLQGSTAFENRPYFILYSEEINPDAYRPQYSPIAVAPNFASTSIAVACNQTGAGFFGSVAADFANGICTAGVFLFVPSTNTLTQWSDVVTTAQTKIPFSYISGLQAIFSGLTASSTANLAGATLAFPQVGSSTPIGSLVPANITLLSTSTIGAYMPETVRQGFLGLQRVALWVGLAFLFYRRIIPHHATQQHV